MKIIRYVHFHITEVSSTFIFMGFSWDFYNNDFTIISTYSSCDEN